jgi:predicted Rossmann fold nucleotide-binding protein DprA/Smf involved in DNA uptake
MRAAIIGSRNFDDVDFLEKVLSPYAESISEVVSGGAKGADSLGFSWANSKGIPTNIFLPEWDKYGRGAGPVRNRLIIENSDVVFAFWDGKSKGTKSAIEIAKKMGKIIHTIDTHAN